MTIRQKLKKLREEHPMLEFRSKRRGDFRCIEYRDDPDYRPGCDLTWLLWEDLA